jgi:hypothetical protein
MQDMVGRMTATGHFNPLPAYILEVIEKMAHFCPGHLVATGMGHYRNTTRAINPLDRSFQTDPAMIDISGFARRQIMLKTLDTSRAMPIDTR